MNRIPMTQRTRFCILHLGKLLMSSNGFGEVESFSTVDEAESFILDMRSELLEQTPPTPTKRSHFKIFDTSTDLSILQG